jgi:hypothetical protein
MSWSLRRLYAAGALALLAASALAPRAGAQAVQQAPPAQAGRVVAGLPLYTSDGKLIGRAIAMGLDDDDEPVLVAEIARPLGIGPEAIAVPTDMFVHKDDRIELTITEAEVNAKLGR